MALGDIYFKKGNLVQGLLAMIGGIAGFFPGIGAGASIGISLLNSILQFSGVSKGLETGTPISFSEIMNTLMQMLLGMTPIGWIIGFVKGLQLAAKGDIKGGLWKMAEWVGPIGMLANLLYGPEKKPEEVSDIGDKGSIWTNLKKLIFGLAPISWIIGIYKGIKYIWSLARTPLQISGSPTTKGGLATSRSVLHPNSFSGQPHHHG